MLFQSDMHQNRDKAETAPAAVIAGMLVPLLLQCAY